MAYTMRILGVIGLLAGGGCTGLNPWFLIETDEDTDATGSSGGPGETSTTSPTTVTGDATSGRTTDDATSDAPTTGGSSSEPGPISASSSSADPSDSDSLPMTASGETGGPFCGDGEHDDELGEECDEGANNGKVGECTSDCLITVCGDNYAGGDEECDLGQANADDGQCTSECKNPVCGDGTINGSEVCDLGPNNGKLLGMCSADCKAEIADAPLKIRLSIMEVKGKFFADNMVGIFAGDLVCGQGFAAMAASPNVRTASTGAFDGKGQQGWVLEKYRAYVNDQGMPLGITGAEGLLGVVNGQPVDLKASIGFGKVWTGLKPTWQTAEDACNGWQTIADGTKGVVGDASATNSSFISASEQDCALSARLYCVQQP